MEYFAADLGGTAVKYGIVSESGEIQDKGSFPTPSCMEDLIRELKLRTQGCGIDCIAVSAPGNVDCAAGVVGGFSAVPWFHHQPIREIFDQELGMKAEIENDANCASLAELWLGAAKDVQDCCFVIFGTGIGGTVVHNREIMRGFHNIAGEFGLLFSDFNTEDGKYLVWSRYSTVHTVFLAEDELNLPRGSLSGKDVFDPARTEPVFQKIRTRFYRAAAAGCLNLQAVCDPEIILIGGGISEREELLPEIEAQMKEMTLPWHPNVVLPRLGKCRFRNDANLIGAVVHFRKMRENFHG